MITGDIRMTEGEIYIGGSSLTSDISGIRKVIGYCPQFDALLEDLTGTQMLEMFGLLRGCSRQSIPAMIDQVAKDLNFVEDVKKKIKSYSNGNKRKLSIAIAIIGNPSLIYLGLLCI